MKKVHHIHSSDVPKQHYFGAGALGADMSKTKLCQTK